MSLEGFSKKGMELGNDPEGIRKTKNATDDLYTDYLNSVKRLALTKMKNDFMFEGQLGAVLRRLTSLGFNVTRESILKDIQTEINKQQLDFNLDSLFENNSELDAQLQTPSKVEVMTSPLPKVQAMGTVFETKVEPSHLETQQQNDLNQSKRSLTEKILKAMVDAGEFSYIPIEEMGKRLDAIQYARIQLENKSLEELEIILSTYSNNYEQKQGIGVHR